MAAGTLGTSAVVGAMDEEIEALLEGLEGAEAVVTGPFTVHRGRLEGAHVLLARCGIGKVNAAALTQALLTLGAERVLFTGVAGALLPELAVGDLVISDDAVQHDLDVTALGYRLGEVPGEPWSWPADPELVALALEAAADLEGVRAVRGRVLSGDRFVADAERVRWLRATFDGACAEMEGAAVAQVCAKWGVPFVIVRSISDTADHRAEVDFRSFTRLAAERAKHVIRGVLRRL